MEDFFACGTDDRREVMIDSGHASSLLKVPISIIPDSSYKAIASERHITGDVLKSIEINTKRFSISPQLAAILVNTVREIWPKKEG
jgi:hypothetical protein